MHVGASLSRVHEETRADFEATLVDMDGGDDHVHLLVEYPPKIAVSSLGEQPERRVRLPAAQNLNGQTPRTAAPARAILPWPEGQGLSRTGSSDQRSGISGTAALDNPMSALAIFPG